MIRRTFLGMLSSLLIPWGVKESGKKLESKVETVQAPIDAEFKYRWLIEATLNEECVRKSGGNSNTWSGVCDDWDWYVTKLGDYTSKNGWFCVEGTELMDNPSTNGWFCIEGKTRMMFDLDYWDVSWERVLSSVSSYSDVD